MMRAARIGLFAVGLCLAVGAHAEKRLIVNLSQSSLQALDNGKVVRRLVINPGSKEFPTHPGQFRISQKIRKGYRSNLYDIHNHPMKKGGIGAPMDYWMRLGSSGMGFHRSSLWSPSGRWGSHGCLRMSRAGARWLFDWAPQGTPVEILPGGRKSTLVASRPSRERTNLAADKGRTSVAASRRKGLILVSAPKTITRRVVTVRRTVTVAKAKPIPAPQPTPVTVQPPVTVKEVPAETPPSTTEPTVAPVPSVPSEGVSEPSHKTDD